MGTRQEAKIMAAALHFPMAQKKRRETVGGVTSVNAENRLRKIKASTSCDKVSDTKMIACNRKRIAVFPSVTVPFPSLWIKEEEEVLVHRIFETGRLQSIPNTAFEKRSKSQERKWDENVSGTRESLLAPYKICVNRPQRVPLSGRNW